MLSIVHACDIASTIIKSYRNNDLTGCLQALNNQEIKQKNKNFSKYFKMISIISYSYSTSDLGEIQKYIDQSFNVDEQPKAFQTLFSSQNIELKTYLNHKLKLYILFVRRKYKDALSEVKSMMSSINILERIKEKVDLNQEQLLFLENEKQEIMLLQNICESLLSNSFTKNQMNNLYTLLSNIQIYQNPSIISNTKFYRNGLTQWNFFNTASENNPQFNLSKIFNTHNVDLQNMINQSLRFDQSTLKKDTKYKHSENQQKQEKALSQDSQIKLNQKFLQSQELGIRNLINFTLCQWQTILNDLEPIIFSQANDNDDGDQDQKLHHENINVQILQKGNNKEKWLENKQYLLVLMGICYEQTQNYEKAKYVYQKLLNNAEYFQDNTLHDLIKLNLSNCHIILGNLDEAKKLIEESTFDNNYQIFQIYNKSMIKLYFEKDYDEALGLLSYLETQIQPKIGIFEQLISLEELTLQKAICQSKCGDQQSAITTLENFQITCNFSSIISISILSYMIQEFINCLKNDFNLLQSIDMLGRLTKTLIIQPDNLTQTFLQGFVCMKLQKIDQANKIFQEIVGYYEQIQQLKQKNFDLILLEQQNILLYSYCCLYVNYFLKDEKKEIKSAIEKIQTNSEIEKQIMNDIFLFSDGVMQDSAIDNPNSTKNQLVQVLNALISVLLSTLFLNKQQQQKYYESVQKIFFNTFQKMREISRQRQQSIVLEQICQSSNSNNQNNNNINNSNHTLFTFTDPRQIDKNSFPNNNANNQNNLTLNFNKEELIEYQQLQNIEQAQEYCHKMFNFIVEIQVFYGVLANFIDKNWNIQPFTFSKINSEQEQEQEQDKNFSLEQIYQQFPEKTTPLITFFYNEILQYFKKTNNSRQNDDSFLKLKFQAKTILQRINFIIPLFQYNFQPHTLALKLTKLKLKSLQGNLNLKDTESVSFLSFLNIQSQQSQQEHYQQTIEKLVFRDLTLFLKELLTNQEITQIYNLQSISGILEQVISTYETSFLSQKQFILQKNLLNQFLLKYKSQLSQEQEFDIIDNLTNQDFLKKPQDSIQVQINNFEQQLQQQQQPLQDDKQSQAQQTQTIKQNQKVNKNKKTTCKCYLF